MPAVSFQLSLVRHGQTVNNMLQLLQGQKLDAPLNAKGRKQARQVGRALKDESFTHVYCSDLKRAIETCLAILQENEHHRANIDKQTTHQQYVVDRRLRERCMGVMEGQPLSILRKRAKQYNQHRRVYTPEGGENLQDLAKRTHSFFRNLCNRLWNDGLSSTSQPDAHVLVVAHSGSIRSLLSVLGQKYNCEVPDNLIDLPCENANLTRATVTLRARDPPSSCESSPESIAEDHGREVYIAQAKCIKLFDSEHLRTKGSEDHGIGGDGI